MRAAIYARVSTLDQNSQTQLIELRQLVGQRGLELVEEYVDNGYSGAKARLPALDKLMADAARHRFDVVVLWAFDRLARSVRHLLETLDELNRLGIQFISLRENRHRRPAGPGPDRDHRGHRRAGAQPDHRAGAGGHAAGPAGGYAHRPQAARAGPHRSAARPPARHEHR
jgi:hypothetical protein